ncbi:MAG: hypothetical protein ACR2KV_09900 [Solirubrobacteraceae bacterium]
MPDELTDRESLRRRLEETLFHEHGPRFRGGVDGTWRRASDGAVVSRETVERETKADNALRTAAWDRWAALAESDWRFLAGAHRPDEIFPWTINAALDDPDLVEALDSLLAIERARTIRENVILDERLEDLARGFWLVYEMRGDQRAGVESGHRRRGALDVLSGEELIEQAASSFRPRGSSGGRRGPQRRLEFSRRKAKKANRA